jgi:hypothetical protein
LVADIGSVNTHVALVDRVGDRFRFVGLGTSLTTCRAPFSDAVIGVRQAIQQIQASTGRHFLTDDGQLVIPEQSSGQGVDAFAAITSEPAPLRVAVIGLSREVSVASALRAVHSTYATVAATLALDESGGRWMRPPASTNGPGSSERAAPTAAPPTDALPTDALPTDPAVVAAQALADSDPDVIVLVGGIDGGATTALYEIANLVAAIAAARDESARPIVIFAGNTSARPEIAQRIGQLATLRMVDNVHPELDRENIGALQRELEALYIERKLARLPGINTLNNWSKVPILPSAYAFENVVRFLGRRYGLAVLGVDIGGQSTMVVRAQGDTYSRVLRSDLGLGSSLDQLLDQASVDAMQRWVPFDIDAEDLRARVLNHSLHSAAIPTTRDDARVMQAAARQAVARAVSEDCIDTDAPDLILLTGGPLTHNGSYGSLALLALDALEPSGVFTLAVDSMGLAPAFGGLAPMNAQAAADVVERDAFMTLGTVIAPVSSNREGQVDIHVQVKPAGSGAIDLEVAHGSLEIVPLIPGQKAALEVRAAPGVHLGSVGRSVFKADVEGGAIGLLIDARGRPIVFPSDPEKRRDKVQKWMWDVGG